MKKMTLKKIKKIFRRVFCGKKFPIKTQLGVNALHISSRYFRGANKIRIQRQIITWHIDMDYDAMCIDKMTIDHVYYIMYTWLMRQFDSKFRFSDMPILDIEKVKFYIDKMLDIIKKAEEDSKWPIFYVSNKVLSHIKDITIKVDQYKIENKMVDYVTGKKWLSVTADIFSCLNSESNEELVKNYIDMKIYDKEQVIKQDMYLEETTVERWLNYEEADMVKYFVKNKLTNNMLNILEGGNYDKLWHIIDVIV